MCESATERFRRPVHRSSYGFGGCAVAAQGVVAVRARRRGRQGNALRPNTQKSGRMGAAVHAAARPCAAVTRSRCEVPVRQARAVGPYTRSRRSRLTTARSCTTALKHTYHGAASSASQVRSAGAGLEQSGDERQRERDHPTGEHGGDDPRSGDRRDRSRQHQQQCAERERRRGQEHGRLEARGVALVQAPAAAAAGHTSAPPTSDRPRSGPSGRSTCPSRSRPRTAGGPRRRDGSGRRRASGPA